MVLYTLCLKLCMEYSLELEKDEKGKMSGHTYTYNLTILN